jgi:hypothetical protein
MQSTLDRKVIYLMLRSARRQEAERRSAAMPSAAMPCALPQSLAGDGWWLGEPPPRDPDAPAARKTETFAPKEISDE